MNDRDAFYRQVGKMVREARKQRGLSQADLAAAVDLTRTSISNIEKGRQKFLLHTFFEFAETLDVYPASLLPQESTAVTESDLKKLMPQNLPKPVREFIEAGIKEKKR